MNVLVLAQYFPPDMGGASTRVSNVVKGLLNQGSKVTVVAAFPHYPKGNVPTKYKNKAIVTERFGTAKVFRVWIPSLPHSNVLNRIFLHFCFVISSLFALPFVDKHDVIWCANPNLFSIFPSFVYSALKGLPIVRNVDDLWPEVFYELGYVKSHIFRKLLNLIAWFSYIVPAAITPISEGYKRKIVAKYGICPDKIHVIEVGIEVVNPLNETVCHNGFVVMYSGVLGLGYNFNIVLDAAVLLSKNTDIVFVVRGVGELGPKLKKSINERCIKNVVLNIKFLPKSELNIMLESADVFMLPMANNSFVDLGLPTKVFEYQAYGRPIVCVSAGDAACYVKSTKSGLIVNPNDVKGFVEAVLRLYNNRKLGIELGFNGKEHVSKNLTAKRVAERIQKVFTFVTNQ